jgi:cytoskeletal protein CcmA (bactofilin family)
MFGKKRVEDSQADGHQVAVVAVPQDSRIEMPPVTGRSAASRPSALQSQQDVDASSVTVISAAASFEGALVSSGPLHLHCELRGELDAPFILVGPMGSARGSIRAKEASVEGYVEGEVVCGKLKAGSQASLHGVIRCEALEVAIGAALSGTFLIGPDAFVLSNPGKR